jgi:hypothetical protein
VEAGRLVAFSQKFQTWDGNIVTFAVTDVTHSSSLTYQPLDNDEPDELDQDKSDGTMITVERPGTGQMDGDSLVLSLPVVVSVSDGFPSPGAQSAASVIEMEPQKQATAVVLGLADWLDYRLHSNQDRIAAVDQIMANTSDSAERELAATLPGWGKDPFDLLSESGRRL